ncbi:MAG: septal ring lytic transglycosylase RlpA family protein [Candidatus Eisenbacteria bacterium]
MPDRFTCFISAVVLAATLVAGCATTGGRTGRRAAAPAPAAEMVGVASYYGREHHGRRTASGERFDMKAMTAAHPTLPFGTRVRVTNLANDRSVIVRINDRGPFKRGRILDVSQGAATELGMIGPGTAKVRVEVVGEVASED